MKKIFILLFISFSINAIAQVSGYKGKKALLELQLNPYFKSAGWQAENLPMRLGIAPALKFEYAYARKYTAGFRVSHTSTYMYYNKDIYITSDDFIPTSVKYKATTYHIGIENTTYKRKYNILYFIPVTWLASSLLQAPPNNWSLAPMGKFRTFGIYYNHIGEPSTEITSTGKLSNAQKATLIATGETTVWQLGYTQGTRFLVKDKLAVNIGTRVHIPLNYVSTLNKTTAEQNAISLRKKFIEQNYVQFYIAVGFLR